MVELVDTHAHLNLEGYERDLEEVIARAREAGVSAIVNVGIDLETSIRALELAHRFEGLYATVGIHPHEVKKATEAAYDTLRALAADPKVVALGEIGLDYAKELSPRERQREHFVRQLDLARELGLPVVIHSRDASPDIMRLLREHLPERFVFHCYTGTPEEAREIVDLGGFVSVTGIVTFPRAGNVRRLVEAVPLSNLMVETDCPFLTPVPHRGQRNEPAFVRLVAEKVAEVKGVSFEECARATTANARSFFGI